jgi:hypothetical protein
MNKSTWTPGTLALVALPIALLILLVVSLTNAGYTQGLFVHTTYYFLLVTVLCWLGLYLHVASGMHRQAVVAWMKENWPGVVLAVVLTVVAWHAVHPALRILSDEANLVGTSKNLFASQSATFTVSGKYYYDSYWDIDVVIDQRPALFPFLVSLIHAVWGYSYKNAFLLNLMVLPLFVLVTYRLAKQLSGETFAIVASLFVVAHPVTLLSVRSGGFDFLALFFALLVIKSFYDYGRDPAPVRLAMLWMNLCMLAEIRYESALFIPPVLALLLIFKMVRWSTIRPYALIYALTPAYLLPRLWQAVLRGSVPKLEPGIVAFSLDNFLNNAHEYFKPILSPFGAYPAHARVLIALGIVGCILWLFSRRRELFTRAAGQARFPIFVASWMLVQAIIVFTYGWGRAQSPAAARLVIAIDTFFSFTAAWALTVLLKRWKPYVAVLIAAAVFAVHVPVAAQHRMLNRLTQTRENATTWRFFESLHEKRIIIVTDRPNLFTIMDYGAIDFETARNDPMIFSALARRLFYDVYVVQQIKLSTGRPLPGYEIWPNRRLETMIEFQNDADLLVRISRVAR